MTNRQIVLRRRPQGLVAPEDFDVVEGPVPEAGPGQAVMEVLYLGIDATVRTWLNKGEGYLPAVQEGEVVRCSGIGRVLESDIERFPVGSLAYGLPGWQRYARFGDDLMTNPLPDGTDPTAMISLYGAVGATAYFGLLEVGEAKDGETVVVSAAAGATGSIAAQVARIIGCRVVGIAGTDEKCAWLTDELGLDAAINHRTDDVTAKLREHCPDRIDVYFDNVGGDILDAALGHLNQRGRVVLCGAISVYNATGRPPGPANYLNLISRRGKMQGFLSIDDIARFGEAAAQLGAWVAEGKLTWREHRFQGLESAPEALNAMFTGANTGKVIIEVSREG